MAFHRCNCSFKPELLEVEDLETKELLEITLEPLEVIESDEEEKENPKVKEINILKEYRNLEKVFIVELIGVLLKHEEWDLAIKLRPGMELRR